MGLTALPSGADSERRVGPSPGYSLITQGSHLAVGKPYPPHSPTRLSARRGGAPWQGQDDPGVADGDAETGAIKHCVRRASWSHNEATGLWNTDNHGSGSCIPSFSINWMSARRKILSVPGFTGSVAWNPVALFPKQRTMS